MVTMWSGGINCNSVVVRCRMARGRRARSGNADARAEGVAAPTANMDPTTAFLNTLLRHLEGARAADPECAPAPANTPTVPWKAIQDMRLPVFAGTEGPLVAEAWVKHMEEILAIVKPPTTDCIKLAAYQLQGEAREWWRSVELIEGREVMAAWTWEQFREVFLDKYFPMHEKLRHERAFLDL